MTIAVGLSLLAHAALLAVLHQRSTASTSRIVTVAVNDLVPSVPSVARATPLPTVERAVSHSPPPRARRLARSVPVAAPPPLPAPTPTPEPPVDETTPPPEPELAAPAPGPAAPATGFAAGAAGQPDLRHDPEMDPISCTRGLEYPAEVTHIQHEVVVRLRVILDDKGHVHDAAVLERAGDSFDETALKAVREKCRFTAARDKHGRPVPFVIDDYRFHFRPADFQTPAMGHFLLQ